jgi:hypothetical protein
MMNFLSLNTLLITQYKVSVIFLLPSNSRHKYCLYIWLPKFVVDVQSVVVPCIDDRNSTKVIA